MGCDCEEKNVQDPEKLRKLAADIAECIIRAISDESGENVSVTGAHVCPPNKLCCWDGYSCTVPFYCDDYFGCMDRFSVSKVTAR